MDAVEKAFAETKARVLYQLSSHHIPEQLSGLDDQVKVLHELLENTLINSQNNAALLMGHRGSGKTLTLRYVLRELKKKYNPVGKGFVEVYLNGFIQTDDTLAMREICEKLCAEHELERARRCNTFSENLEFLVEVLQADKYISLPIFFILDEFHMFAERGKQTLLYNLCDLLQSTSAQIAIIGLTCRLDAYELLEKRIRSRISYRRILCSHVANDLALKNVLARALFIQEEAAHSSSSPARRTPSRAAGAAAGAAGAGSPSRAQALLTAAMQHNEAVELCLQHADVSAVISRNFDLGRDVQWFFTLCSLAVASLSLPTHPVLTPAAWVAADVHMNRDHRLELLSDCSALELSLLVAVTQLEMKLIVPYNFTLIYEEYLHFHRNSRFSVDRFPKDICLKSFERLLDLHLLVACSGKAGTAGAAENEGGGGGGGGGTSGLRSQHHRAELLGSLGFARSYVQKQFASVRCTLQASQITEMVMKHKQCPTWIQNWVKSFSTSWNQTT